MKRTVFYSWQSGTSAKFNRNFIESALKGAIKCIGRDQDFLVDPTLDRDTSGKIGAPDIADSIFGKIAASDLFVADITLVPNGSVAKAMPNSNVLIELGYAIALLGGQKILLIQNTSFGPPEHLPFDLRGRRILTYNKNVEDEIVTTKSELQAKIESTLRDSINEIDQSHFINESKTSRWWGRWTFGRDDEPFGGTLNIIETGSEGFDFELSVFSGAHSGNIKGYATITSKDRAFFRSKNGISDNLGEITFKRNRESASTNIEVEETASFSFHHGAGVNFSGVFLLQENSLTRHLGLNEIQVKSIYSMSQKYFEKFSRNFQLISKIENKDNFECSVVSGGIRGMFTFNESILMIGECGEMWFAFIDDDNLRYFTNVTKWKYSLPESIEEWRSRFVEKRILFG